MAERKARANAAAIYVFALSCIAPAAALATPATQWDIAGLQHIVNSIAARHPMDTAQLGVTILEADSGRTLASRLADAEFAPASNFKLLVAASALAYLGPASRLRTYVLARGPVARGTLAGDLILVGGGDPLLARDDLRNAASAIKSAGIERVEGAVLGDSSLFDGQRYGSGWAWDDMPYYYQPPVSALAVDEGTVGITVDPGPAPGSPAKVVMEPSNGAMTLVDRAVTTPVKGTDDVDCVRSPGSSELTIGGHYPLGKKSAKFRCAVNESDAYTLGVFSELLKNENITVTGTPRGGSPPNSQLDAEDRSAPAPPLDVRYPGASILWTHESPALLEIVRKMMPPSDNFIADDLMKLLPTRALRQRGSFSGGAEVERKFIASLGLDPASIDNGDGSGLSQGDRITPRDLATLLRWEALSRNGKDFIHALGQPGISGTVRRHLKGTDAVGRVWAKDGYIWHVSTFSGYAFTLRHGLVIFSIMVNNANGLLRPFQNAQDSIVRAIVDMP